MSDLKIIGSAVEVHISNLVEPDLSRLVRHIDEVHVQTLKEEYKRTSTSFGILAGVVWGNVDVNTLKEPQVNKIEVIGGNHLRAALQELHKEGTLLRQTLLVKLYSGLTNEECLQIGYYHNEVISKSKQMTFMEIAELMRRKLEEPGKKRAAKKALSIILGYDDVCRMNDNKKTHLRMAQTTQEIFDLAKQADELASRGQIDGIKAGHLMQSRFSVLFGRGLTDEVRVEALKKLIDSGTKAYRTILKEYSDTIKKANKYDDTGIEGSKEEESLQLNAVEVHEDVEMADPSDELENARPTIDRPTTDGELQELKLKYQTVVNENLELHYRVHALEKENASMKEQLEQRKAEENGKSDFMSSLMLGEPRDNPISSNAPTDRTVMKRQKKQADLTEQRSRAAEFFSGEKINARYSGNGIWYEAIIIKKISSGTYLVEYTSDGIQEKRTKKDMKKL